MDVLRYHEISEGSRRILNPISGEKIALLGEICRLDPTMRVLDLACGKGELLCGFATRHGVRGVGIDLHPPFVADARARAAELGVAEAVTFLEGDAAQADPTLRDFDVVSCIGASWIGGGLAGTLALMSARCTPAGWLLVGEVFWDEPPPEQVRADHGGGDTFVDLAGTLARFDAAGLALVEMVIASHDDWDRYAAGQWLNVHRFLATHPDDPDAASVRQLCEDSQRAYLAAERRCVGWGVFVLRRAAPPA